MHKPKTLAGGSCCPL